MKIVDNPSTFVHERKETADNDAEIVTFGRMETKPTLTPRLVPGLTVAAEPEGAGDNGVD
ncbi:hypothetical protein [Roseiarcus fermentans]|uniref:hypothetical protein n=1 Tax=Roseiarcus fermentans TaxID=1473586 RepID=UPI0011BF2397|nr:hypothetical protein [Roseiarcus fermentans]